MRKTIYTSIGEARLRVCVETNPDVDPDIAFYYQGVPVGRMSLVGLWDTLKRNLISSRYSPSPDIARVKAEAKAAQTTQQLVEKLSKEEG